MAVTIIPASGTSGTTITITGAGSFSSTPTVTVAGIPATVCAFGKDAVTAIVPAIPLPESGFQSAAMVAAPVNVAEAGSDPVFCGNFTWELKLRSLCKAPPAPLTSLRYYLFFLGDQFATNSEHALGAWMLTDALAAAMSDSAGNTVLLQYAPPGTGAIDTTAIGPYFLTSKDDPLFGGDWYVRSPPPHTVPGPRDLNDVASTIVADWTNYTQLDPQTCALGDPTAVVIFVLPPGARLTDYDILSWRPHSSVGNQLAGIHGNFAITPKDALAPLKLFFCAAVWSDDLTNGIAVPGWPAWQNTCATLYRELVQSRTDPDVDQLPETGPDISDPPAAWVAWCQPAGATSGQWMEICNLPALWNCTATGGSWNTYGFLQASRPCPIGLAWSNDTPSPTTQSPPLPFPVPATPAPYFAANFSAFSQPYIVHYAYYGGSLYQDGASTNQNAVADVRGALQALLDSGTTVITPKSQFTDPTNGNPSLGFWALISVNGSDQYFACQMDQTLDLSQGPAYSPPGGLLQARSLGTTFGVLLAVFGGALSGGTQCGSLAATSQLQYYLNSGKTLIEPNDNDASGQRFDWDPATGSAKGFGALVVVKGQKQAFVCCECDTIDFAQTPLYSVQQS